MKFPPICVYFFLALTLGSFIAPAQTVAQATTNNSVGPRMAFSSKEYHFGKISTGEKVHCTFVVTNIGDQTLIISSVTPGCHCTTVGNWSQAHRVEPGQTADIPIVFDSSGLRGDIHRTITVASNDKLAPRQTLMLMGSIWKAIDVIPQFANIVVMPDGVSNSFTMVRIVNQGDAPITLSEPTSANHSFTARLKAVKPGKEFELTVTAVPPLAPGNTIGSISIKTSLTNMPLLQVTAIASMQAGLSIRPMQISVVPRPDRATTNFVDIVSNTKKPLALSDLDVTDKRVTVQMKETNPGRFFEVSAVFPAGYNIPAGQSARITVKSNHPQYPLIVIPINQYPRWPSVAQPLARPRVISQNPTGVPSVAHP